MIRVVIADDEALVRNGLAVLLRHEPGFEVAGLAADGLAAIILVREHHPDVVLMDIRMPGIDGLEATRRLARDPATGGSRVLVLTTFDHDENVAALRAGPVDSCPGHRTRQTAGRDPGGGVRRVAAGAARHPAADRGVPARCPGCPTGTQPAHADRT